MFLPVEGDGTRHGFGVHRRDGRQDGMLVATRTSTLTEGVARAISDPGMSVTASGTTKYPVHTVRRCHTRRRIEHRLEYVSNASTQRVNILTRRAYRQMSAIRRTADGHASWVVDHADHDKVLILNNVHPTNRTGNG